MANCPNCGAKLRLTDWKPVCPECGVNLNYYNANERLLVDSEKAEIEHAHFQPRIDRAKAAYAGSKLAVLRIVFTVLPIGALFLPLCVMPDAQPKNVNVIGLYNAISGEGLGLLFGSGFFGASIAALLLSAIMILVCIIGIIAALGKHGKGRTAAFYGVMACAALAALLCFLIACAQGTPSEGMKLGAGGYLYALLQLFSFAWCVFLLKKGIPVRYTPCVIGGLPSEEYFSYVNAGMPQNEIRRKMLVALTKMQVQADEAKTKEQEAGV